jgi:hypothetical protein
MEWASLVPFGPLAVNAVERGLVDHGRTLGIGVQIVARNPAATGIVPAPIQ